MLRSTSLLLPRLSQQESIRPTNQGKSIAVSPEIVSSSAPDSDRSAEEREHLEEEVAKCVDSGTESSEPEKKNKTCLLGRERRKETVEEEEEEGSKENRERRRMKKKKKTEVRLWAIFSVSPVRLAPSIDPFVELLLPAGSRNPKP
jgi:hypothetical protein